MFATGDLAETMASFCMLIRALQRAFKPKSNEYLCIKKLIIFPKNYLFHLIQCICFLSITLSHNNEMIPEAGNSAANIQVAPVSHGAGVHDVNNKSEYVRNYDDSYSSESDGINVDSSATFLNLSSSDIDEDQFENNSHDENFNSDVDGVIEDKLDNDNEIEDEIQFEMIDDTDSFDISYINNPVYDANQPIYDGASISLKQSMLLVLRLSLKHNLTDSCISDILYIIQFHCSEQNKKKISMYHFKKLFNMENNSYVKHYYCSKCLKTSDNYKTVCDECNQRSSQHFFVTLSIVDQLQMILDKCNFIGLINDQTRKENKVDDCIGELYDGSLYREKFENRFATNSQNVNVSFTWCTDGVPMFKSSKTSIWPFYLRINELPFSLRVKRENTILAGLWYGSSKPYPNLLLKPMRNEFELLYQGVSLKFRHSNDNIKIRAVLLVGTCDLPAKSLFLNMTQFNGEHGCPSCECAGINFEISTGKIIKVFPYIENYTLRSLEQTLLYAQEALNNKFSRRTNNQKTSVKGIKGPCSLSNIMPDYVKGIL